MDLGKLLSPSVSQPPHLPSADDRNPCIMEWCTDSLRGGLRNFEHESWHVGRVISVYGEAGNTANVSNYK